MRKKKKEPTRMQGAYIYPRFGGVRAITTTDGKSWFCLLDVMKRLELGYNSLPIYKTLNPKGVCNAPVSELKVQETGHLKMEYKYMPHIDEGNLYRCIFQSTKPEALKVQNMIFEELLPAIRMLKKEYKPSKRKKATQQNTAYETK